jgi:hypothetical protein
MSDIKRFLSTPEKPVSAKEAIAFWETLTEAEKEYYRNAKLED